MGNGALDFEPPYYNAAHKELLGWLTPTSVTSTGVYNLSPFELSTNSFPLALKLSPVGSSESFYMEYRQPLGFDAGGFSGYSGPYPHGYDGILIHMPLAGSFTQILNMNPLSYNSALGPTTPALTPGSQYVDYASRFSVTTTNANSTSLQLRILEPPLNSPTLMIVSPADGATVSGSTSVAVDALDRTGVTKVEVYLDGVLVGTEASAPYQLILDTTQKASGVHTLTAEAYNAAGSTYSQQISVQISNPSVTITAPEDQTVVTSGGNISLIASASADSSPINKVEFFQNGTLTGPGILTGSTYTLSWTNVAAGTYAVTAKVTCSDAATATSSVVNVTVKPPPQLNTGGSINAASFVPGLALTPGSLVAIYGSNLGVGLISATAIPLPMTLGGATVTFNGISAPLLFVSSGQINAQVPWNLSAGTASLVVNSYGSAALTQTVQIGPFSPGIFTLNYGTGQTIAINLDGTVAAAAGSVAGLTTHPAAVGDTVVILATGLGAVTPTVADGSDSSDTLRTTVTTPVVLIGGVAAAVGFSGLSPDFVGVNQLNVTVPAGVASGNAVPLQIKVGGITTSALATLAIR